jgi:DNA invertase Pin-like site-specific DNA recombinase
VIQASMNAGLYARVSSEEQAEGYSIEAQVEAMRRFCQDRGWSVVREYIDPGVSGTIRERPRTISPSQEPRGRNLARWHGA